ncbi:hypothetical protein [Inquilinus sp.]|jgi:hypothetical protein|uniref:hypothetical protein n=1 Tax=Inquilinus sp. TaxID=1932117 RepID=UPI0037834A81
MSDLKAASNPPARIIADEIEKIKSLPAGSKTEDGASAGSYLIFTMLVFEADANGGHMTDIAYNMSTSISSQFDVSVSVTAVDLNDGTIATSSTGVGFSFYSMRGTKNYYYITLPSGTLD